MVFTAATPTGRPISSCNDPFGKAAGRLWLPTALSSTTCRFLDITADED